MHTTLGLMLMTHLAAATPATAQQAPYALLVVEGSGPTGQLMPVTVPVDFEEVARASGVERFTLRQPPLAALERPDGTLEPLPAQFDADPPAGPVGRLSVLVPEAETAQRVRVYFTSTAPELAPPSVPPLRVQQDGGRIVVANEHFRVTHDPAKLGGLPSRIEFVRTGKVCETFALNDRVHAPEPGGFRLAEDAQPTVTEVGGGGADGRRPVCAVVRVAERYVRAGEAPPSAPRAVYEFTYYAGSPVVRVRVHVTQNEPFAWSELHVWELNFPDQSFTHWLTGETEAGGELVADQASHQGSAWGGLSDGENLLGVVAGSALIYDGRGQYGTYLHGPWVSWGSLAQDLEVTLWLGSVPRSEAAAVLRTATEAVRGSRRCLVTTAPLEARLAALEAETERLPARQRARWRWLTGLLRRQLTQPGALSKVGDVLRQLERLNGEAGAAERRRHAGPGPGAEVEAEAVLSEAFSDRLTLLSNAEVGWAVGRVGGLLQPVSCFDFGSGRELASSARLPLWRAVLQRPDGSRVDVEPLPTWAAEVARARDSSLTLRWHPPAEAGGGEILAAMELDGPNASWTLSMANLEPGWSVREVRFPQIAVGPVGDSPDDDYILYPRASGELKQAPLRQNVEFVGMYPDGWCTFQCMAYYDRDCGLYFGCHDPLAATKQIITRRTDDGQGQLLTVNWYAPDMGVAGNGFATGAPTAIRPYQGDWFDATQIYRDWAEQEAQWWPRETEWGRPDTPQWMREVCVWALTSGKPEDVVPKVKEFAAFLQVPTAFHWYSWHQIPFDVEYPHYFPTWPGMTEGVRELQAAGVRVMPYINGRLWDTALQDFQDSAIAAATKGEDGQPYIEEYGSGAKLAPMCPTQRLWQEKVQEIVMRLVTEVGVDGVYIDQIGAAAPRLCMDRTHGHPLGGGHWWTEQGYWPLLRELQAKLPAGKMITTECNAESYARYFDGYLTWHWQFQDAVPAFPAIYGGRVQLFSRAYNGDDQQAHWMRIGQQLVFGEQLGWVEPEHILAHAETADFMRRAAQTRHALLESLSWGRMARPPAVRGDIPTVTADWAWSGKWIVTDSALQKAAWWAEDGRLLLLFANTSGEPISAELAFDGAQYGWPRDAELAVAPLAEGKPGPSAGQPCRFRRTLNLGPREILGLEVTRTDR